MQKLLLLGDPKYKFPETKPEMNAQCRSESIYYQTDYLYLTNA